MTDDTPKPRISAETRLQMAALILAVRTARFEGKDFEGMGTPRMAAALWTSLSLADKLCRRALELHEDWF